MKQGMRSHRLILGRSVGCLSIVAEPDKDTLGHYFYRAEDGDRIDEKEDGTFQDKWGTVWLPESTQS
jgi:hypothetical protein